MFVKCLDPGSNWGPIPLQGSALPTELSRRSFILSKNKAIIKPADFTLAGFRCCRLGKS